MKKIVVYFLLFIFTIQTTKSLWIITTFHINREYIAENLCINRFDKIPTCKGQCFLDNQLDKEQKDSKKNITTIEKETVFIAPTYDFVSLVHFSTITSNKIASFHQTSPYTSFVFNLENPPELV